MATDKKSLVIRGDRLMLFLDLISAMTEYHRGAGRWPEDWMNPRRFSWDRIRSILGRLGWPEETVKRVSFHTTPSWTHWPIDWQGLLSCRQILFDNVAQFGDLKLSLPPLIRPAQMERWQAVVERRELPNLPYYERDPMQHALDDLPHHERLLHLIAAGELTEADFKEP